MKWSNLVRGVLCCLFFFAVTTLHAQSSPSLVEAAKKEGKLVYYTVLTLPESRALVTAFEKRKSYLRDSRLKNPCHAAVTPLFLR